MTVKAYASGNKKIVEAGKFTDALKGSKEEAGHAFDSSSAQSFVSSQLSASDSAIPESLAKVFDSASPEVQTKLVTTISDSISAYEERHNCEVPPDIMNQVIHNVGVILDDASSEGSSPTGLQTAQALVSIQATLAAAVPFAHYATSENTEVPIAILNRYSAGANGMYAEGGSIDGINSGKTLMGAARAHTITMPASGAATAKLTAIQTDIDVCDQNADAVAFLPGRGVLLHNGRPIALEHVPVSGGASTISGTASIGGTSYTITGTFNSGNGDLSVTLAPANEGLELVFESYVKFEGNESLIPGIGVSVAVKSMYAMDWKGYTEITREAFEQLNRELGLDGRSEGMIGIQTQFTNERHYTLLINAVRLAQGNLRQFNLEYTDRKANMAVADMWRDLMSVVDATSQTMAEQTNSHGVGFMYVTGGMARFMRSLPREIFTPSGQPARPGIYRMGTLSNGIEVYYTPRILKDGPTTSQILLIGRGNDVARSAFVMGDVVPPILRDFDPGKALAERAAFYGKNFTGINPHEITWGSAALVEVSGMPAQ